MVINRYIRDIATLLFPPVCAGCLMPLVHGEKEICLACWYHLPFTNFHKDAANEGVRQLRGLVPTMGTTSYLYFHKCSRVRNIMHQLKYRNRPGIGELLGKKYGEVLRDRFPYNTVDGIVPVPLHTTKLRKRGYNQSLYFAKGLSLAMKKPILTGGFKRVRSASSQTRKNRYQRFENVRKSFKVSNPELFSGKHILLVDDVLTTGATLEGCIQALLSDKSVRVCVVTLARTV